MGRNASELLLSDEVSDAGLLTALYDCVGTALGVPVHRLLGQKVRDWVPCAAWTRPATPAEFQADIQRAVDEGYMTFKIHTSEMFDVFEQVRLAEEVAPDGFRIHFDFNHNRTLAAVLPVIAELEQHPIVAYIEDPLKYDDIDGWRKLREQTRIPLVMQGVPIPHVQMLQVNRIACPDPGPSRRAGFDPDRCCSTGWRTCT